MWCVLAVLSCALGMGSKEAMVSTPLTIALFDRVFVFDSFRQAVRARRSLYAGLASTWLILAGLLATAPRPGSAGFSSGVSPWVYLLNQPPIITRYLAQSVWPDSLVSNYGGPVTPSAGAVVPCAVFLLVLGALTVWGLRRWPRLGFLGAWFFITLAPASSVVPVATEAGAERRMYLPLAALVVLAVVGVSWLWDRFGSAVLSASGRPWAAPVGAAVILASVSTGLAATTVARNREYASDLRLAQVTVERYPTPSGHHVLAERLLAVGKRADGMAHLRLAAPGAPRAHYTLGVELFNEGKLEEAIPHFQAFIEKQPDLVWVIDAHGYLGRAFTTLENWPAAIEAFSAILRVAPGHAAAARSLADVLSTAGRYREAIPHYRAYLATQPRDARALNQLGMALGHTDQLSEALAAFRQAAAIDARDPAVQRNLALAYLGLQDLEAAIPHARQAVALQPDDPGSRELLRLLLAERRESGGAGFAARP